MEVAFVRNKLEARDKVIVSEALIRQCLQLEDKFREETSQPQREDAGPGRVWLLICTQAHGRLRAEPTNAVDTPTARRRVGIRVIVSHS
jgi:hypothetical protein